MEHFLPQELWCIYFLVHRIYYIEYIYICLKQLFCKVVTGMMQTVKSLCLPELKNNIVTEHPLIPSIVIGNVSESLCNSLTILESADNVFNCRCYFTSVYMGLIQFYQLQGCSVRQREEGGKWITAGVSLLIPDCVVCKHGRARLLANGK